MPTLTAATEPVSGSAPAPTQPLGAGVRDGVGERHVGAGDGRGAGAAVGLQHVAVEHDGVLAQGLGVDDGAQAAPDEPADLVGAAADPALDATRGRSGCWSSAGSIAYSAVTQPDAAGP